MTDLPYAGQPPAPCGTSSPAESPTIRSEELLQGHREIIIRHGDDTYRLRVTKAGKLILNK